MRTKLAVKRTTVFLTPELIKLLDKQSEKTGAPVAELIRRAVKQVYGKSR
jgi:predicted DNA-binding protein